MECTGRIHTFAVGGTPHPAARCRCDRVTWRDWSAGRVAKALG
jgi:hypothetical protein